MGAEAATGTALKVYGSMTGRLNGSFTGAGTSQVQFTPNAYFKPGEQVWVSVTRDARNAAGVPLATPRVYGFTAATATAPVAFGPPQILNAPAPIWVKTADFDRDGDVDIASLSLYYSEAQKGSITFQFNNGAGIYNATRTIPLAGAKYMCVADLNGDGYVDVGATSSAGVHVFLNDGLGTFTGGLKIPVEFTMYPDCIESGDFNGDGAVDLVFATQGNNATTIAFNDGTGNFPAQRSSALPPYPLDDLCVGDFDNDGDADLAVSISNQIHIKLNDGTGNFPVTKNTPASPITLAAGDLDRDGDLDVVTHSGVNGEAVSFYSNNGDGSLIRQTGVLVGPRPRSVQLADMDGDGDLDVVYTATSLYVSVLLNDGTDGFTFTKTASVEVCPRRPNTSLQPEPFSVSAADLDGDHDLDVVTANVDYASLSVLLNGGTQPIISPLSLAYTAGGGNKNVAVTYNGNWTAITNQPWLTVVPASGTGSGTVAVTAAANPTAYPRTAVVTIGAGGASRTVTVTQAASPATLAVSPSTLALPHTYHVTAISIASNANTAAVSDQSWLSLVTKPNTGFGNRSVEVYASPNISARPRSGTLTVTGEGLTRTVAVTQAGAPSQLWVNNDLFNFPPEGGSESFTVESNNDWRISGKPDWLILSADGGADTASVTMTAAPVDQFSHRSCTLTVTAGDKTQQITIHQAGIERTLSVAPAGFTLSADSASRTVRVSSNTDWQVRMSVPWLAVSPASGRGDGSFTVKVLPNSSTVNLRSGTVTVFVPGTDLAENISINQFPSYLSPTRLSFAALSEGKPLEVRNGGTWSLSSSESWLTTSLSSHTGAATVTVSVTANPGPALRTGRITLTYANGNLSQTVFVSQDGAAPLPKLPQSITFAPLPAKTITDAPFALTATASSGLAVSYRSSNPLVATVSGNVLTLVGEGTAVITATQGGDVVYLPAPEVSQTLTVAAPLVNTWRGTDTWGNAAHWSEGAAPTLTSDGVIAGGTARVSGTAQVSTLTLLAGTRVEVPAGSTLIISGDLINRGGTLSGTGRVRFTKAGTASLTGSIALSGTVEIAPGTTLSTGGGLILQEGAILLHGTGTAGGGGSVVGNITSKRTGKTGSAYNGWSSPVSNAATGTLGRTVYAYDETRAYANYQRWLPTSGTMQPAKGYFARGAGSVAFTGTANEGTFTLPLSYTISHPLVERGFNLVGNPYPGPIDYDAFIDANPAINGALYFWDDDQSGGSGYDNADYAVRTAAGVVAGPNSGALAGQGISAHQGFFVQALGAGSVTFTNAMRRGGTNPSFFRKSAGEIGRLKLSLSGEGAYKEILVAFAADATAAHDRRYDALRLEGPARLGLFSRLEDQDYAIQALPSLSADRVVALSVEASRAGDYWLKAAELEAIDATYGVLLEDKLTGQLYDLRLQGQVSLHLEAGAHRDRFVLHFKQAAPLGTAPLPEPTAQEEMLQVFAWQHRIYVRFSGETSKQVSAQLFNLKAQMLEDFPAREVTRQLVLESKVAQGQLYLLRLTTPQGVVTKRILLGW
jgi:hypothetical protein